MFGLHFGEVLQYLALISMMVIRRFFLGGWYCFFTIPPWIGFFIIVPINLKGG
jgi:hypothetical protein